MDGLKQLTPSARAKSFEASQRLGEDSQRASMVRTDITVSCVFLHPFSCEVLIILCLPGMFSYQRDDMNGRKYGKWEGFYRYCVIAKEGQTSHSRKQPSEVTLDSVFEANFRKRVYLVLLADNPEKMQTTGDKLADLESGSRPCKFSNVLKFHRKKNS